VISPTNTIFLKRLSLISMNTPRFSRLRVEHTRVMVPVRYWVKMVPVVSRKGYSLSGVSEGWC